MSAVGFVLAVIFAGLWLSERADRKRWQALHADALDICDEWKKWAFRVLDDVIAGKLTLAPRSAIDQHIEDWRLRNVRAASTDRGEQ